MASSMSPNLKPRSPRVLSWKLVTSVSALTLSYWFLHPGDLFCTINLSGSTVEASQPTDTGQVLHPQGSGSGAADHNEKRHADSHKDPVAEVLLAISIILLLAKISGDVFERVGMPAVLGELSVGILLGNWQLMTGSEIFDFFKPHPDDAQAMTGNVLDMLSRIGVVLLLFTVGLESRIKDMASVGVSSLLVAIIGVIAPMALGFGVGYLLVSEDSSDWQVPAFLGATLCATSVGITARVLRDIGKSKTRESSIILGAAVIDDVLGLVVLAVVAGVIREGEHFEVMSLFRIVGLALAFLTTAMILGAFQLPRMMFKAASFLRGHGLLVTTALTICFLFSWAANHLADLATIIGAFAAGLILEGAHYQEVGEKWKNRSLEDALAPLTALLVPVFFVATGIAVDLSMFSGADAWILAIGLTVVAIIGKLVCAWGVWEPGINKQAVGLGMIPRGEVGLIFAGVGRALKTPDGQPVVDDATFSAIVMMVMITTMISPPMLKWSLGRKTEESERAP
ncbi:MAG: cation:proton antiporter [Fuerstiella sp.]|nr:cation:proton antiporter [Fuerstiella sp.]